MPSTRPPVLLALATAALVTAGCGPGTSYYTPDEALIDRVGDYRAADDLRALLERARGPLLYDIRVAVDEVSFTCRRRFVGETGLGPSQRRFHNFDCRRPNASLAFADIARIEIVRPDRYLVLRNAANRQLMKIMPRSREDALPLVDLLAAFRDRAARFTGAAQAPLIVQFTRADTRIVASTIRD